MNEQAFLKAYNESRNGANFFVRHPLARQLQYSDGVKECADAGCYWLLDVIATECLMPLRNSGEVSSLVQVQVDGSAARIAQSVGDDQPPIWEKQVEWTDMPTGDWTFELVDEGERFALILLSER